MSPSSSPFAEGPGPAFTYVAFRTGAWCAQRLPLRVGAGIARVGAAVAYLVAGAKRRTLRANLARVLEEGSHLERAVREGFHSYARYWLETFRLGRYSAEELLAMVDPIGVELLEAALGQGRGVVLVGAHFGFYDIAVAWGGVKGYPVTSVGEVLRPRALFEWFVAERQRRGQIRILASKPGAQALRRLLEALDQGRAVVLVSERDLGRRGVWVRFFGEKTTFPVGPGWLVSRSGAPLLIVGIYSVGKRYRLELEEIPYELSGEQSRDVPVISQAIARGLERLIRKAPEQWHLFSTNWPSDEPHLPPRGNPRRHADAGADAEANADAGTDAEAGTDAGAER
ncbi:MAG: phosphatidylinositol mannoside acyltransferase [Actinomycetota bacterium]